jgi:adenylyltransferase/sulfurtransferase
MTTPDHDRYARQRLIEWWDQERLAAARVLVAGAGALGNELLKNLALLGAGRLLVVDFDHIEPSNLSRTALFRETDVGRSKVEVAAAALARLNPEIAVTPLHGDLFYDVGLGHYRHSDLVIGCLDSLAARAQVGMQCALAGVPFLDGGMWAMGGEVRWLLAGDGPCFDCTMNASDRARADERRSCTGFRDPALAEEAAVPTVAITSAVIGGLLAQEAAKYLCGHSILAGKSIVYHGQALTMHRAELVRDPACAAPHEPYSDVQQLPRHAAEITGGVLLEMAKRQQAPRPGEPWRLALGRDFLLALHCPQCGRRQEVNRPWGQVLETERTCPHCEAVRRPDIVRTITEDSPYATRPLADLGVPPGEVLAVHRGEEIIFYELTGDIRWVK